MSDEPGKQIFGGPNCRHIWVSIVRTNDSSQPAKRVCKHCEAFLGFENPPDDIYLASRLRRGLKQRDLTNAEKEFLWSIEGKKTLTPGQHKYLKQITDRGVDCVKK